MKSGNVVISKRQKIQTNEDDYPHDIKQCKLVTKYLP